MGFAKGGKDPIEREFDKTFGKTQKSFGRQWLTYEVQDIKEDRATFMAKTGIDPVTLRDKLVLDAGCGGGRYTYIAAQAGAEVIAVDLSESVRKAKQLTQGLENVHIMQGDMMELPLRRELFDFIYSIGVLHHTPDTRRAFFHLVPFLKPGGTLAVWVYRRRHPIFEILNSFLRALTTRLPHSVLHYICFAAIPLGLVKHWSLQRTSTAWISRLIPPMSSHPNKTIRICDTFDWYSPKYQWHHKVGEVKGWFQEAGFKEIQDLSLKRDLQFFHQAKSISIDGINISGKKI